MTEPRLIVGRIVRAHGIRGECVVHVESDSPETRFAPGSMMEAEIDGDTQTLTVQKSRPHQDRLLVVFDEVPDRNAAEALRGAWLSIGASDAAPPPEGTYYPHEIEGFDVRDEGGALLGKLQGMLENPAHDIWVVRTPAGTEVLVPAIDEFIQSVDTKARTVVMKPIGGMFE